MVEHLDPSELGTKEYWDEAYIRELKNHSENPHDEGTVWFDDSGAEDRMVQAIGILESDDLLVKSTENSSKPSRFLDLGTGNGHMLLALQEDEWEGQMVGVDYSESSIQLARGIAQHRIDSESTSMTPPVFEKWDIMNEAPGTWLQGGFDVVIDKGTFDAISLSSETDTQGRRIYETYRDRVLPLLKPHGFFVITSCNWTEEELLGWFDDEAKGLTFFSPVTYADFSYGGRTGSSVSTLVLRKSADPV